MPRRLPAEWSEARQLVSSPCSLSGRERGPLMGVPVLILAAAPECKPRMQAADHADRTFATDAAEYTDQIRVFPCPSARSVARRPVRVIRGRRFRDRERR